MATQQSIARSQFALLLNKLDEPLKKWALASYSVRLLNTSVYTGPTMRLRREDGVVGDLYTAINGSEVAVYDLNRSANYSGRLMIKIWQHHHTLHLVTWFDQSGNGKDLTQTTASLQPKVYLLTTDNIPVVMLQSGSSIQADLGQSLTDFSVLMQGDITPSQSGLQSLLTVYEKSDQSKFDSLDLGQHGLSSSSDIVQRGIQY